MDKLALKNKYKFCYTIIEKTAKGLLSKVSELNVEKKPMFEIRLDPLLSEGMSTEEIINLLAKVRNKCAGRKLIATIRTINEGGYVDLTKEKYFFLIKALYLKSKVNAIDVEYRFYKIDQIYYDSLFKKKKKDIIISMHFFDRVFYEQEYKKMFIEMAESKGNIVKFAIKIFTKDDLFAFMQIARKSYSLFKSNKKKVVFIAMGDIGKITRIIPEYTYTQIVFLSPYVDEDHNIGQLSLNAHNKYRKLLVKKLKN